jgi:hypothetical protein
MIVARNVEMMGKGMKKNSEGEKNLLPCLGDYSCTVLQLYTGLDQIDLRRFS